MGEKEILQALKPAEVEAPNAAPIVAGGASEAAWIIKAADKTRILKI